MTSPWTPGRLGNLTGKRVVVTGATNGVGLGTARALAKAGAHVILAVRNTELGEQRATELMGGSTTVARVDLADLSSVRAFAQSIDDDIDILINNAGALTERRTDTVDGFEKTLGTNLLGPFALTNLLLPRVRSQIINVGSDAHRSATLRLDDLHLRRHKWTRLGACSRSSRSCVGLGWTAGCAPPGRRSSPSSPTRVGGLGARDPADVGGHKVVKVVADRLANDIDEGAAPTLLHQRTGAACVVGRFGLRGGPCCRRSSRPAAWWPSPNKRPAQHWRCSHG